MKYVLPNILVFAMISSAMPSIAHADNSPPNGAPPAAPKSIVVRDPAASDDEARLRELRGPGWFSPLSHEVNKRFLKMLAPGACGFASIKALAAKATMTAFSAAPLTSLMARDAMKVVDARAMEVATGDLDERDDYDKRILAGGAVSVVKSALEGKSPIGALKIARITGNAAFIHEITKPQCLGAYLSWQRARTVAMLKGSQLQADKAKKKYEADVAKAKAVYDASMSRSKKAQERAIASSQSYDDSPSDAKGSVGAFLDKAGDFLTFGPIRRAVHRDDEE